MLGTIYIGLSGMNAYSKGLDVISNNVANLNTPGFKLTNPSFSDALYRNASGAVEGSSGAPTGGAGVAVDTGHASFRQGELRDTGNPLDAGVDGSGFFAIDRDGESLYTRAGQFEFDEEGVLVERTSKAHVLVSTESNAATSFDLDEFRSDPPRATTEVALVGSLAQTGAATYDLPTLSVIDASGARNVLKAKFVRDGTDPKLWTVEVSDAANNVLGSGTLRFNSDGTPAEDNHSLVVTVKPGTVPDFDVTLKFGAPGQFSGVTSIATATTSQLSVQKQTGVERGTLMTTTFDDMGRLKLTYSNGQIKTPATLLLAQFDTPDQVEALGDGLYRARPGVQVVLASPQTSGRGRIVGSKVEMSNVDLTQQFTDLIIIQRGYQASSQMTSVANEMIQQLLSMGQGR